MSDKKLVAKLSDGTRSLYLTFEKVVEGKDYSGTRTAEYSAKAELDGYDVTLRASVKGNVSFALKESSLPAILAFGTLQAAFAVDGVNYGAQAAHKGERRMFRTYVMGNSVTVAITPKGARLVKDGGTNTAGDMGNLRDDNAA